MKNTETNYWNTIFTKNGEIIPSNDFAYVFNNHLSNIEEKESTFTEIINEKHTQIRKSEAKIGDKDYILYKYDYLEWLFIPKQKNLFESDFDDIIKVSAYGESKGFAVSIMNKKDGVIRIKDYRYVNVPYVIKIHGFIDAEKSIQEGSYGYTEINDEDNKLFVEFLKSGKSVERFMKTSLDFSKFEDKKKVLSTTEFVDGKTINTVINSEDKDNNSETTISNLKPLLVVSEKRALNSIEKSQTKEKHLVKLVK